MKLYYCSGSLIPSLRANSVHVMKMCAAFARTGFEVTLFAQKGSVEEPFSYYNVERNFTLVRAPFKGGLLRVMSALASLVKRGFPDIAYGRDPWFLLILSFFLPVILELHEVPRGVQKNLVAFLMRQRRFKGAVCVSNALKKDALLDFDTLVEKSIFVAHDGADVPDEIVEPMDIGSGFHVGYAGSMLQGKGADFVVRLAQEMPEIQFHLCGGSDEQIAAMRAIYNGANIHYYGHLDQALLQRYLLAFDVALAPYEASVIVRTGADIARWISPLKLFEYMAARACIVSSDLQSIGEVISHGETGLLLPRDDLQLWVRAINDLRQDESFRQRLADQAYEALVAYYSWDQRAGKIKALIEDALKTP